jgi:hypothetical protein
MPPAAPRNHETKAVIPSEDIMILRLTTIYENGKPPLSPFGERVAHDGVFISRRGPGEGVPIFMAGRNLALLLCSAIRLEAERDSSPATA